ncbi:MAG: hypothetical protein EAZ35_04180 [Sphingobacteriia bacterium]|nr:MAG: hypothetical protein EAZ35_04180 [Sphingobacteriia bacterium]
MKLPIILFIFLPFYVIAQKDTIVNKPYTLELGTNLVSLPIGLFAGGGNNGGYVAKNFESVVLNNPYVFPELKYAAKTSMVTNIFGLQSTISFARSLW